LADIFIVLNLVFFTDMDVCVWIKVSS